jgi:hypothetical protein
LSHTGRRLTDPVLAALRAPGDLQVDFRQDELPDVAAQPRWALRFADALNCVPRLRASAAGRCIDFWEERH